MERVSREMSKNKFATFVFMDIETTGLIEYGKNPMIMELCLVSVQREELLNVNGTARVLNKLVLCFNPQKPISAKVSELTGLYNDCLESQHVFCLETAQLINGFLQHLPQPVCLLAHNGNYFDFPILLTELNKISQPFVFNVFCADSLEAFRSLDGLVSSPWQHNGKTPDRILQYAPTKVKRKESLKDFVKDTGTIEYVYRCKTAKKRLKFDQEEVTLQPCNLETNLNTSNEEHREPKATKTETMIECDLVLTASKANLIPCNQQNNLTESNSPQLPSCVQSLSDQDLLKFVLEIEKEIEHYKVPKEYPHENKQGTENDILSYKEQKHGDDSNKGDENVAQTSTPCNQTPIPSVTCYVTGGTGYTIVTNSSTGLLTRSSNQIANHSNSKQRFEIVNDTDQYKGNNSIEKTSENKRKSYKLEKIYERTFQKLPLKTHDSESDSITLLKVVQKIGLDFLSWVDSHAVHFSAIKFENNA